MITLKGSPAVQISLYFIIIDIVINVFIIQCYDILSPILLLFLFTTLLAENGVIVPVFRFSFYYTKLKSKN